MAIKDEVLPEHAGDERPPGKKDGHIIKDERTGNEEDAY
jgi:hypothetical protein